MRFAKFLPVTVFFSAIFLALPARVLIGSCYGELITAFKQSYLPWGQLCLSLVCHPVKVWPTNSNHQISSICAVNCCARSSV